MFFRVLFRAAALVALLVPACVVNYFTFRSHAANPATEAKHGLTGSYYVANLGWGNDVPPPPGSRPVYWSQVWVNINDFRLPRTFTAPAASRVDSQIAFGQGKGFKFSAEPNSPRVIWWPTGLTVPEIWQGNGLAAGGIYVAAVIWKGYVHLPRAGTYYFGIVSNAPSAVYLNQARVALNGNSAPGVLVTDAFTYAKEDVQDFVQNYSYGHEEVAFRPHAQDKYVVPVPIDGPRDLPIEVQYNSSEWGKDNPLGVDLFWVTPDAPRDANGKPIAQIVPSEALYTEPPGTIEKPTVRGANSTIEAEYLYFPVRYVEGAVGLTIRLADKDGNPIAGKRVHVNSLVSNGYADSIVQPEKPTDEKGETTAKIRPYEVGHDSAIFATDVTDFVDVAQVAHVTFQEVDWNFLEPFSPYYDAGFLLTPNPPVVGRPTLIKTKLKNHSKFPARVMVTFLTSEFNIGGTSWAEIAKVKDLTLQPGEWKEVSTTFTPKEVMGHKCFRVEVEGRYIAMNPSDRKVFAAALLPPMLANPPDQVAKGAQQINTVTVAPPQQPPECGHFFNGDYAPFNTNYGLGNAEDARRSADDLRNQIEDINKVLRRGDVSPQDRKTFGDNLSKLYGIMFCVQWMADNPGAAGISRSRKEEHQAELAAAKALLDYYETAWRLCISGYLRCTLDQLADLRTQITYEREAIEELEKLDPSDPNYRRLAVAASDSAPAHMEALRVSLERYQGAEAAGDPEWMARHLTATRLYEKRVADTLRRDAAELEHAAQSLPPDNPQDLANLQANRAKLLERVRQAAPIPPELRKQLLAKGIAEVELKKLEEPRPDFQLPSELKSLKDTLLDSATLNKTFADHWQQLSDKEDNQVASGRQRSQPYAVANPHDNQENVELFIRPISIPADWKLSIVNAEPDEVQGQKPPDTKPPQYPVREVEAGKHYAITLPAKTQTKVTSVLIPVGEVGARTTARWAVEGKIGNELIGGMVHEMIVPYIIADLKLPPVGSKEVEEELPVAPRSWSRIAEVAAGVVILALLVYFFIFWRRRHRTTAT